MSAFRILVNLWVSLKIFLEQKSRRLRFQSTFLFTESILCSNLAATMPSQAVTYCSKTSIPKAVVLWMLSQPLVKAPETVAEVDTRILASK